MMDRRKRTGRQGEEIAAEFLAGRGYRLIQRNWHTQAGELDLIMEQGDTLIFVEVRTRRGKNFGSPEESVTPAKQARLIDLAQTYLQEANIFSRPWRIDVVGVYLGPGLPQINHIENAVGW